MNEQKQNKTEDGQDQGVLLGTDAETVKPTKRGGNKIRKVVLFSCLVGLIVMVGMGGFGWQGYRLLQQLPTKAQLMLGVDQALTHAQKTDEAILVLQAEVNDARKQSIRLVSRMDDLSRKVVRLQGSDRNNWLLAEVEYMLRLANQRLLTMRDVKSAMTLLSEADQLLIAVDEYGLFPVRQALAEDIAALKAIEHFDLDGTWLKINALIGRIDELSLLPSDEFKPEQPEQPEQPEPSLSTSDTASADTWQEHLKAKAKNTWNAFIRQFRIRTDRHEGVTALLSPSEALYLRQNLHLMLKQAQLALLERKEVLYQTSLSDAQSWLQTWFLNRGPEITVVQSQLSALQQVSVFQRLPDISRSVVTLKSYVNDLAEQQLPVTPVRNNNGSSEAVQ